MEVFDEAFFVVDGLLECCSGARSSASEFFVLFICFKGFLLVFFFKLFSLLVEGLLDGLFSF